METINIVDKDSLEYLKEKKQAYWICYFKCNWWSGGLWY